MDPKIILRCIDTILNEPKRPMLSKQVSAIHFIMNNPNIHPAHQEQYINYTKLKAAILYGRPLDEGQGA